MKVGIIGLGRVGTALACALFDGGYKVLVCSRKVGDEGELDLKGRLVTAISLPQMPLEADLIFITTTDGVIPQIVESLKNTGHMSRAVLHMSGSLGAQILSPLRAAGCSIGSLHPLQSFASVEEAMRNLPGSCFTYEGDPDLLNTLKGMVEVLGGTLQVLPSPESKVLYHAGACLVSNYLVLLADLGIGCLEQAGFARDKAQQVLLPLMQGTLNNLAGLPPEKALTGPVARGDLAVVSAHLAKLEDSLPEVGKAYSELTPLLGQLAVRGKGLSPQKYQQLLEILHGGVSNG